MEEKQTVFQKLMGVINKIGSTILLNLLFLVSCLGVVTMGSACSGLYSAVRFSIRGDSAFAGFREGFKKNFLRVTIATAISLVLGYLTLTNSLIHMDVLMSKPELLSAGMVLRTAVHVIFCLAVFLFSTAMIPVNVYFENDANGWVLDSWYLVIRAFPQVLISAGILWLPLALFLVAPMLGFLSLLVFIAVYYAVMAVVITALLKNTLLRILQKHKEMTGEA